MLKRIRQTAVKQGLFIRVVYPINVDGDGECQDSGDVNVQAARAGAHACAARRLDRQASADVGGVRYACVYARASLARVRAGVREFP